MDRALYASREIVPLFLIAIGMFRAYGCQGHQNEGDKLPLLPLFFVIRQLHFKEYVASLIGLYKNSGAVSCVAVIYFLNWSLYLAITETKCLKKVLEQFGWSRVTRDINRNCNTFLQLTAYVLQLIFTPSKYELEFNSIFVSFESVKDMHSAKRIVENMCRIHLKRHTQKIPP